MLSPPANYSFMSDKLLFTPTQPEYRFKPGDRVVNTLIAGGFREGKYAVEELHSMKMIVLEVGIDPTLGFEGYHLVYYSQPEPAGYVPGGRVDPWFVKEFVESNFEIL
jgi:hypothetical protein